MELLVDSPEIKDLKAVNTAVEVVEFAIMGAEMYKKLSLKAERAKRTTPSLRREFLK